MISVAHIVSSDAFAGLERHVLRLCAALVGHGFAPVLVCPPTAERLRDEARSHRIAVVPGQGAVAPWPLAAAGCLHRMEPTIVHVHDGRSALAAAVLAPSRAAKVRTHHFARPASVDRPGLLGRTSSMVHRRLNDRMDAHIAVSEVAAAGLSVRRELTRGAAQVIPPGILLADEASVAAGRRSREERHDELVVVFAGRLEQEKCVDVLLEALAALRSEHPQIRAIVAGAGGHEGELRALSSALGLADTVEWTGWLPEPDAVLARADVYVNPWPDEGFGMAMAEAMAFELPVVAPASGASPEVVADGLTGILVPPRDPVALAATLARLAVQRTELREMGKRGRERSLRLYGMERTAERTASLYRRIVDRRSS